MKTVIKIVKRESKPDNTHIQGPAGATERRLTTELIVKNWIIEARERRQVELHNSLRWKQFGGLTRG